VSAPSRPWWMRTRPLWILYVAGVIAASVRVLAELYPRLEPLLGRLAP